MNYNLGLVGHPTINDKIERIISNYFNHVNIYKIGVINESDLAFGINKAKKLNDICNGFLFTAKDIYNIFGKHIDFSLPCTHIEIANSQLYKAFFKIAFHLKGNFEKISIDSVTYSDIVDVYNKLEIPFPDGDSLKLVDCNYEEEGYIDKIIDSHILNNKLYSTICITQFTVVKEVLEKKKIPVIAIESDNQQVIEKVNKLISKSSILSGHKSSHVVINISLSNLNENIIIDDSEYSVMLEYNRIGREIFWYAKKLEGAHVQINQKSHMIFCDREIFDSVSDFFSKLDILNAIAKKHLLYVNIGVGYGKNSQQAVKHSVIANIRSGSENKNSAYVMYDTDKIAGPLLATNQNFKTDNTVFDLKLKDVAEKSKLSINTIYKLHGMVVENNTSKYTSIQIAENIGITRRSVNRILEKLEANGYAQVVDMKSTGQKGRPTRIYKFNF